MCKYESAHSVSCVRTKALTLSRVYVRKRSLCLVCKYESAHSVSCVRTKALTLSRVYTTVLGPLSFVSKPVLNCLYLFSKRLITILLSCLELYFFQASFTIVCLKVTVSLFNITCNHIAVNPSNCTHQQHGDSYFVVELDGLVWNNQKQERWLAMMCSHLIVLFYIVDGQDSGLSEGSRFTDYISDFEIQMQIRLFRTPRLYYNDYCVVLVKR